MGERGVERGMVEAQPSSAAVAARSRRERWIETWEKWTSVPLLVMALAMVPLLLVPAFVDLSDSWQLTFLILDVFIWFAFSVDFVVRLGLSTAKKAFLRHNWVDLLIIAVPFLRPLRILRSARALRVLRLTRLAGFLGFAGQTSHRLLTRHGLRWVLLAGGAFALVAAIAVWEVERGASQSNIDNFGDAAWWAITTATTVNYGDAYPSTTIGKVLAVMVMLVGVTIFTMVTANLAAMFVASDAEQREEQVTREQLSQKLDVLLVRMTAIEATLGIHDAATAGHPEGAGS